jgi:Uma2 family endonuclease
VSDPALRPATVDDLYACKERAEYFAAGTLVLWDGDLLAEDMVRVFRHNDPLRPTVYRRGGSAEAEPALPGWTMPVDGVFD